MHDHNEAIEAIAKRVMAFAEQRTRQHPIPLGAPRTAEALLADCGQTITEAGIGGDEAMRLFEDVLHPASLSVDNPRYLSFVPAAPTEAAVLFDLVVGASSIYGGSWLEGAGAVFAENQALAWIVELAGMPKTSGGVFVPGGTMGNLAAMVAARDAAARKRGSRPDRWAFITSTQTHSSVQSTAAIMDADVIAVDVDGDYRLNPAEVEAALDQYGDRVAAVIATAGTTNLGVIDDLRGVGELCRSRGVWMHVDGAYGGAALASPRYRPLFDGIELADSFIVDPHKWLFAPFDCCALLYRDPQGARISHGQHAGYLDFLDAWGDWNPSDFAVHLTRRARGLPFWFSVAVHGTQAYANAVDITMELATYAAEQVRQAPHLDLVMDPELSIVVFERKGWSHEQYRDWSLEVMHEGSAFVVPSRHAAKPCYRFCFVNPRTTHGDIDAIIDRLRTPPA
ncbi:MAG: aspartate aminotransferase family protein [Myxococcota bacterium]